MATNNGLSIKLLIDTKAHKVCFAEAGKDFVEFLSSLLCLPVSTVVKLLTNERMVGSIGNVLGSLEMLDAKYVLPGQSKGPYLFPVMSPSMLHPLKQVLDAHLIVNTSIFTCEKPDLGYGFKICGSYAITQGSKCPNCSKQMNKALTHVKTEGFLAGTTAYTVKDDLSVTPASGLSSVALLAQCGVKDLSALEEKTVKLGKEEALEILLASFKSKTVLTDVFLQKKNVRFKRETTS